jgi:methylmalonyl-CoA/ethylmalonyl-CoA epimerase
MSNVVLKDPNLPGEVRLHHIGYVVTSIQDSAEPIARSLGATWDGNIIFDPIQKVRVTFFEGAHAHDALIELVEPGGPESPVSRFLKAGGHPHHLCYEVGDMERHLAYCKSVGTLVIRKPAPAVAFGGRRIAWALTRQKLLLELLERQRA